MDTEEIIIAVIIAILIALIIYFIWNVSSGEYSNEIANKNFNGNKMESVEVNITESSTNTQQKIFDNNYYENFANSAIFEQQKSKKTTGSSKKKKVKLESDDDSVEILERELMDILEEHPVINEPNVPIVIHQEPIIGMWVRNVVENVVPHFGRGNTNIILRNTENPKRERKEKVEDAIKKITKDNHANDPQNTHDPTVIKILKDKYNRLIELNKDNKEYEQAKQALKSDGISDEVIEINAINQTFIEIEQFLNSYIKERIKDEASKIETTENKEIKIKEINDKWILYKDKVLAVLKEAKKGNEISTITTMSNGIERSVHENVILYNVWTRFYHNDNSDNLKALQVSLLDNMEDAVRERSISETELQDGLNGIAAFLGLNNARPLTDFEKKYNVQCINGRVSRYLNSFVVRDKDEILSKPILDEKEIGNLIYLQTSRWIFDGMKEFSELNKLPSNKPIEDLYGEDYENLNEEELAYVKKLEQHIKSKIEKRIRDDYGHFIKYTELREIIRKALSLV